MVRSRSRLDQPLELLHVIFRQLTAANISKNYGKLPHPKEHISFLHGIIEIYAFGSDYDVSVAKFAIEILLLAHPWLVHWAMDVVNIDLKVHGYDHRIRTILECLSPIFPLAIDCFGKRRLRYPSRMFLEKYVSDRSTYLPDAGAMLMDYLIEYGLKHDDTMVRQYCICILPRFLGTGVISDSVIFNAVLEGLSDCLNEPQHIAKLALKSINEIKTAKLRTLMNHSNGHCHHFDDKSNLIPINQLTLESTHSCNPIGASNTEGNENHQFTGKTTVKYVKLPSGLVDISVQRCENTNNDSTLDNQSVDVSNNQFEHTSLSELQTNTVKTEGFFSKISLMSPRKMTNEILAVFSPKKFFQKKDAENLEVQNEEKCSIADKTEFSKTSKNEILNESTKATFVLDKINFKSQKSNLDLHADHLHSDSTAINEPTSVASNGKVLLSSKCDKIIASPRKINQDVDKVSNVSGHLQSKSPEWKGHFSDWDRSGSASGLNVSASINTGSPDPRLLVSLKERKRDVGGLRPANMGGKVSCVQGQLRRVRRAASTAPNGTQVAIIPERVQLQTPIPVGCYDQNGGRINIQTTIVQPLPLSLPVLSKTFNSNMHENFNFDKEIDVLKFEKCAETRRFPRITKDKSEFINKDYDGGVNSFSSPTAVEFSETVHPMMLNANKYSEGNRATIDPPTPSANSIFKSDNFDYLDWDDLRPSPNAKTDIANVLNSLPNDSWPEIFHTLNSTRRLAKHHSALIESHAREILRDVIVHAQSLRSQVSKNALLALGDLWKGLGKILDSEIALVAPLLIKKLADKVGFLREAAERTIQDIILNGSDTRVLSAFMNCFTNRSPLLRAKCAAVLLQCIPTMGLKLGSSKEAERLLCLLPQILQDGNQETRNYGKAIVRHLFQTEAISEKRICDAIPAAVLSRFERDLRTGSFESTSVVQFCPKKTIPPPNVPQKVNLSVTTLQTRKKIEHSRSKRSSAFEYETLGIGIG